MIITTRRNLSTHLVRFIVLSMPDAYNMPRDSLFANLAQFLSIDSLVSCRRRMFSIPIYVPEKRKNCSECTYSPAEKLTSCSSTNKQFLPQRIFYRRFPKLPGREHAVKFSFGIRLKAVLAWQCRLNAFLFDRRGIIGRNFVCRCLLAQESMTLAAAGGPNEFVVAATMRCQQGGRCDGGGSSCHRRRRLSYCVSPHEVEDRSTPFDARERKIMTTVASVLFSINLSASSRRRRSAISRAFCACFVATNTCDTIIAYHTSHNCYAHNSPLLTDLFRLRRKAGQQLRYNHHHHLLHRISMKPIQQ